MSNTTNSKCDERAERLSSAVSFTVNLHQKQTRKGTSTPYAFHLFAVADLVMEAGGSDDEIIAALLHDSLEDQGDEYLGGRDALRHRISSNFGKKVLDIVNECTDDEGHQKGAAKTLDKERAAWMRRKKKYAKHLLATDDIGVLRVSCADKLHNARTVLADYQRFGELLWQRFRTKRKADQVLVYDKLAEVFETKAGELKDKNLELQAKALRDTVDRIKDCKPKGS